MNIVRDEEMFGLAMIPLFCDWHIKRCNVENCEQVPTTIITQLAPELPPIGLCEEHFQDANKDDGGRIYSFVFDDFDAFKKSKEQE